MSAHILHIQTRYRESVGVIASLADFTWIAGDTIDASLIIDNPSISLYCLDDSRRWAVFVVLPQGLDLSEASFVYQAQFDHAEYLIGVAYETFHQLANTIQVETQQLVCIHNIGRCGSTLLSQALNEVENVTALSEPDVFTNFLAFPQMSQQEQINLLQSSYKLLFRPAVVKRSTLYVLKFRNQCIKLMELFVVAFPQSKHLFMYRNALDWLASWYRMIARRGEADMRLTRQQAIELLAMIAKQQTADIEPFFDLSIEVYSRVSFLTVGWIGMLTRYIDAYQAGIMPLTIRYEDLISHQDSILKQIIDYLGLPPKAIASASIAFERDSQAGTSLARDDEQSSNRVQLPAHEIQAVMQILSKQSLINQPDMILPGTLQI